MINVCFFIGTVLADCLICQPISYRWDRLVGGSGACGHQKSLDLFIGIFNLLLDVTVVVMPMPVLWGLKMAVGKKLMLSGMFGMGTAYVFSLFPFRQPSTSAPNIKHFENILTGMIPQSLCSNSLPHLRYHHHHYFQRARSLRYHRHAHIPRSSPRHHQRLSPRPQTHIQQNARHCTQKRQDLIRQGNPHMGHHTHFHARKSDVDSDH